MARSAVHKQSFSIRGLPTRSVTLYPSSATVIRDIPDVVIKPGTNEYTITHISRCARRTSFKVSGHGTSASVVSTSPESVEGPNDDATSDESSSSSEEEDEGVTEEKLLLKLLHAERDSLALEHRHLNYEIETVMKEAQAWEKYAMHMVDTPLQVMIDTNPEHGQREVAIVEPSIVSSVLNRFKDTHESSVKKVADLQKKRLKVEQQQRELQPKIQKTEYKVLKQTQKQKKRHEKLVEKRRQRKAAERAEKESAYPHWVLKVVVEAGTIPADAPSVQEIKSEICAPPTDLSGPSLRIEYTLDSDNGLFGPPTIGWTRSNKLEFNTEKKTAVVTHRAQAYNTSSEDWKSASITLSSVQKLRGLFGENVPVLEAWKLGFGTKPDGDIAACSTKEWNARWTDTKGLFGPSAVPLRPPAVRPVPPPPPAKPAASPFTSAATGGLFGTAGPSQQKPHISTPSRDSSTPAHSPETNIGSKLTAGAPAAQAAYPSPSGFGSQQVPQTSNTGAHVRSATSSSLFGSTARENAGTGLFGTTVSQRNASSAAPAQAAPRSSAPGGGLAPLPYDPSAKFSTATSQLSTTSASTHHTLPGTRTLPSDAGPTMFLLSETTIASVSFRHVTVPKLNPAVFLAASFPLSTTLDVATAELAVDGINLGSASLYTHYHHPDGSVRDLPLAIDDAVQVTYEQPRRKDRTEGTFRKESVAVFERSMAVKNGRTEQVEVVVRDQLPARDKNVEGEMKVERVVMTDGENFGEEKEGVVIERAKKDKEDNDGEEDGKVEWKVTLPPGKSARLELGWEVRAAPQEGGKAIISLS